MYYLNKINLMDYILFQHSIINKMCISPVKLQKTLYLLYALWAGSVMNISDQEKHLKLKVDLFDPNFEAWHHGPVDSEIYHIFNSYREQGHIIEEVTLKINANSSKVKKHIVGFVDDILNQCFEVSDFALIEITKEDTSWKKAFINSKSNSKKINKEDIAKEYYLRWKGG